MNIYDELVNKIKPVIKTQWEPGLGVYDGEGKALEFRFKPEMIYLDENSFRNLLYISSHGQIDPWTWSPRKFYGVPIKVVTGEDRWVEVHGTWEIQL